MDEDTETSSSVVVLEDGAEWPQWIAEYQKHTPNSVVVAHTPHESIDELALRVVRRVSDSVGELRVGIVVCSPSVDEQHIAARERICRALLDAMLPEHGGEVVLAARIDGSDASKHAIFELAGTLCEGLHDTRRVVRVRFSSGRPESGIMHSLAPTRAEAYESEIPVALHRR